MTEQAARVTEITLHRIRPERNERRFYRLEILTDLFGIVLLRRRWGRIGTDGQARSTAFADAASAQAALGRWRDRKCRNGYVQSGAPAPPRLASSRLTLPCPAPPPAG